MRLVLGALLSGLAAIEAGEDHAVQDSRILLLDMSGSVIASKQDLIVDVTSLQSIVCRSLGVAPLETTSNTPELMQTSFFKSARANVLITVNGLGSAALEGCVFLNSLANGRNKDFTVRSGVLTGVSTSTAASLAAMTTGLPTSHDALRTAHGIADIVVDAFPESLTLAMGGAADQARTFCVQQQSVNSICFDANEQSMALPPTSDKLQSELRSLLSKEHINFDELFNVKNNWKTGALALFLNEMESLLWVEGSIEVGGSMHKQATDEVPDFYSITFSSLKGVQNEFGVDSSQARIARLVVDVVIKQALSRFAKVYPQRVMVELAFMGVSPPVLSHNSRRLLSQNGTDTYGTVTKANVTPGEVDRFHIVLWLSVLISLALLAALYNLAFMSFKKDELLYGTFNPGWEHRKRA